MCFLRDLMVSSDTVRACVFQGFPFSIHRYPMTKSSKSYDINQCIGAESRWSNFDPYSNPEKNVECEHILSAIGRILPRNRESEASNEEALDELSVGSRLEQMGAAFAVAWDQRKSLVWRRDLM